jgi:hypothetical protein
LFFTTTYKIKTMTTIYGPGLTYQYSEEGEVDTSHGGGHNLEVDLLTTDLLHVPSLWQASFKKKWRGHDPDKALARLQELEARSLERLPGNPFVLRSAWVIGVLPANQVPQEWVAARQRVWEAQAEKEADEAREGARKAALELRFAEYGITLVSSVLEGGAEPSYLYTLRGASGREWRFRDRNIFDFGRVVNPAYPILPGRAEGGLCNTDPETGTRYWMDFQGQGGWCKVRDLDPEESVALDWVYAHGASYRGIRM